MTKLSIKSNIFTKIADLGPTGYYNIKCSIIKIYDWISTKSTDYVMTLQVKDDSIDSHIFIKIFSPSKIFINYFYVNRIYMIYNIKKFKDSFYILSKENKIEECLDEVSSCKDYSNSKRNGEKQSCESFKQNNSFNNKFHLNKDFISTSKKEKFKTREIKDLSGTEYIKFTGKLIEIQEESNNLVILSFIDYTVNDNIENLNKGIYDNNMVIFVKVWDKLSEMAKKLEIKNIYTLENVKIQIKPDVICGTLSDTALSKIYKSDSSLIIERENNFLNKCIDFSCDHYKNMKITNINDIKEPGFYKIKVFILNHFPADGKILFLCKICKIINEEVNFDCNCKNEKINVFTVKFSVKDESGQNILVCVNKIAKKMLALKVKEIFLYVKSKKMNKIFVHEVKKIPENLEFII